MKPSFYLDLLMDFEQIYTFLNNHSGLGVENGLEEK